MEGELAGAKFQRDMIKDGVKSVCQCVTPWRMGIFWEVGFIHLPESEWAGA